MKFRIGMLTTLLMLFSFSAVAQNTTATDDTNKQDQQSTKKTKVKKGSKDDVDAVGNRDMGKTGLGNWVSIEKEMRIGKAVAQQVEESVKFVQDPMISEYVNRVGQNLVRNSDAKVPFTIRVVDSDEVNAFAMPGGFFYVNSGLILAADSESELAGVMAHEIAHVAARHWARGETRGQLLNLSSIPLIFIGGWTGFGARTVAQTALPMTFLTFSRGFEAEADYLGVQYLYKTGYDPQGFVSFFEKLQAKEKRKPGTLAKAFSSHPLTPDRIEASQNEIAKILPAKEMYIANTSEFDQMKVRLALIENKRKVVDKDEKSPTLRRTAQPDDSKKGDDKDDDRPTLKKRD
ncbi:MAG TPA: M48 family metallopeptidase [Terriglobales bacterium]|nr:M48 family metallopeptidase [Terriglobales bacterium]